MKFWKLLFIFFSSCSFANEALNSLTVNEFKELVSASDNKKNFYVNYLGHVKNQDEEINSIINLYSSDDLYKSYIYARRSEWRGVPILLKDNIDSIGLPNTAGSLAMKDNFPRRDAHLVKNLKSSGFMILGKANLSEWANFRGQKSISGWSSYGGQTRNPYNLDYNPCGSSSGSAVAVASGIVPVSIGTETNGSITCPASINGVVGIKPTVGLVSRHGIIPISSTQDTAGPMARNVLDAAIVLQAISGKDPKDPATKNIPNDYNYDQLINLDKDYLRGKVIGLLKPGDDAPEVTFILIDKVKNILIEAGADVVDVAFEPNTSEFWSSAYFLLSHEFNVGLNDYLKGSSSKHKSMASIIDFNKQNSDEVMPFFGQEHLENSIQNGPNNEIYGVSTTEIYDESKSIQVQSRLLIDGLLQEEKLDAIIGLTRNTAWKIDYDSGDTFSNSWGNGALSAISGYPHITIPLDYVGEFPTGLSFMGTAWDEINLLNLAYSFEQRNLFFPKPINKN